jgi:tetratricopeptide (TPR) repeat protein
VLLIQRQITTQIVLAIGAELAVDAAVPANSGASGTPAYHAYLLGLARYKLGADEDIAASLDLFQEAIDLDPSLAEAWGGLALALSWSRIDPEETLERTRLAADRALALDPNLDTAFMARARLHLLFDWDLAAARDGFQRALALNPGSPSARMGLASVLSALGRHDEAVAQINAALQLDPLSVSSRTDSAWYRYFARRHQEAIADARLSIELEPHDVRAWHVMLYAAVAVNDQDVAREVMGHRLEDIGVAADEVARIVGLPFAEGQQAFWERYVGWVGSEQFAEYVSPTYSVPGMVFLGQHDAAIDNLREGVRTRSNWMIPFLEVIPFLDPLRTEPDFIALVEELRLAGLPQTP